jgi:hypothetical protein
MFQKSNKTLALVYRPFFRLEHKIRNPMDEDD